MLALEREIFQQLRLFAAEHAARIRQTAAAIAELDVTCTLAQVAAENRYTRPKFSDSGEIRILAGRHPVIEKLAEKDAARFIPNDLYFDAESQFISVITGPNMGGKSTYLRQAAAIVILAQMGSFVPADSATLSLVDRVFTRIGAADNLARGRSTFMVEMTETAVILNTATARSLVVLDEIGRGTATYDGLALAWSVIEHIHQRIRARTLFATHYHELTELADQLPGVRNLHVSVKEAGDQVIFLRKVEPGRADRSYGIEVARLAGLPVSVIERAREILALHERSEHAVTEELSPRPSAGTQIQLFEPVNYQIAERIRNLKVDELRPIEALQLLNELQRELPALVIVAGLISGTSADGIDVAVVDIAVVDMDERIRVLATATVPYPREVRDAIFSVSNAAAHTATIARLNFLLGELFAEALEHAGVPLEKIELIGSHGQTIFHEGDPVEFLGRKVASTLQIGEAAVIAARTGIETIADFRPGDIAYGGKGAPLVPLLDYELFRHPEFARVALNIGGIANITVIPANARAEDVIAFDTGPGNMVIDALAPPFDRDGERARAGKANTALLDSLLADPYYRRAPPENLRPRAVRG